MNILFVSSYPSDYHPYHSTFVYNLVQHLSSLNNKVQVISPLRIYQRRKHIKELPGLKSYGFESAVIYRPKFISFPNRLRIGTQSAGRLNITTYHMANLSILKNLKFNPDIIYSHFLFLGGPSAIKIAKKMDVPAVVALGESTLEKYHNIYGVKAMRQTLYKFNGLLCVSNKNKNYCINQMNIPGFKIKLLPNAVDTSIFYPRDKVKMREKYNLPINATIVAFTGHFIERKGPMRVLAAINELCDVKGIFIGKGSQVPRGENVLFAGSVPHHIVPELLSTADIFVLPTINEGSCNAILEAQACGLPIVSSDISAVREQLDNNSAILVNPNSVNEISNAIQKIITNGKMREKFSKYNLQFVKKNDSRHRANSINNWLHWIHDSFKQK